MLAARVTEVKRGDADGPARLDSPEESEAAGEDSEE